MTPRFLYPHEFRGTAGHGSSFLTFEPSFYVGTPERPLFLSQIHESICEEVASIDGDLLPCEHFKLYEAAYFARGPILELGRGGGKATAVLALGLRDGGAKVPFYSLGHRGHFHESTEAHLRARGLRDLVTLLEKDSVAVGEIGDSFETILLDGDPGYHEVMRALEALRGRIEPGAVVLVTQSFDPANESGVYGVAQALAQRAPELGLVFHGRFGGLALYERTDSLDVARTFELSTITAALDQHDDPQRVIEIGNVLSHHQRVEHSVLDPYELAPAATWNEDLMRFTPPFSPTLVVSVSAFGPLAYGVGRRKPGRLHRAVRRIISWLAPGGRLLLTLPVGQDPVIADFLESPDRHVTSIRRMRRSHDSEEWEELTTDDDPDPRGETIAIVEARAPLGHRYRIGRDTLSIFVVDGLRRRQLSGYGMLSRKLTLALVDLGHDVRLLGNDELEWEEIEESSRERLQRLPHVKSGRFADIILQIASPPGCRRYRQPSLIYTQNALGDLPPDWIKALGNADGVIVPSEFDRVVFARHIPKVFVAPQSSDPEIFYPQPERRADGHEAFTFLYVGSYGFRKGVDLLLKAFLCEFSQTEPVDLRLQCPDIRDEDRRHCSELIQKLNPAGRVFLDSSALTPEAMNHRYNESDCVVTLSRGEGWCMPLSEALLCEVPVIAPRSTGMLAYLDDSVAELLGTRELPASQATLPFGAGMAATYGSPGITYYEPDVSEARAAMRRVYEHHLSARAKARLGRARILERFSWEHAARDVERACRLLLADP
jgi:glycosyltransferase involved in cell wall biosynthesis